MTSKSPDVIHTVITKREHEIPRDIKATTPGTMPDVETQALPAWQMIMTRVVRVYIQGFLGFITAGATGLGTAAGIPAGDFMVAATNAAMLAIAPTTVTLLWNSLEILQKWDTAYPAMRA